MPPFQHQSYDDEDDSVLMGLYGLAHDDNVGVATCSGPNPVPLLGVKVEVSIGLSSHQLLLHLNCPVSSLAGYWYSQEILFPSFAG